MGCSKEKCFFKRKFIFVDGNLFRTMTSFAITSHSSANHFQTGSHFVFINMFKFRKLFRQVIPLHDCNKIKPQIGKYQAVQVLFCIAAKLELECFRHWIPTARNIFVLVTLTLHLKQNWCGLWYSNDYNSSSSWERDLPLLYKTTQACKMNTQETDSSVVITGSYNRIVRTGLIGSGVLY